MRLIIKEYLSMLKESEELDALLPDLLLQMGFNVTAKPQKGVRQFGVDIEAIHENCIYLFTIKQGDIDRDAWNKDKQSVRQSLDEIQDVYIPALDKAYKKYKKKIVLVTNGNIKQEVKSNWEGYITRNFKKNISFEFWGSDKLALEIEKFLLNEHILSSEITSLFRKTLVLLDNRDYKLNEFNTLLKRILFDESLQKLKPQKLQKEILKRFITINLILNIIFHWGKDYNNLKSVILCSEQTIMATWEAFQKYNLSSFKNLASYINSIFITAEKIFETYYIKIEPYCKTTNGICANNNYLLNCITAFEVLGFLGIYGFLAIQNKDKNKLKIIQDTIKYLITNHLILNSPCYDNQIIDITLAILVLSYKTRTNNAFISQWLQYLGYFICFAYTNQGIYFPIDSDSFDDLVEINISNSIKKEAMFKLSTLIPTIIQIAAVLNLKEAYKILQSFFSRKEFKKCNFQIWYPTKDTDKIIYINPYACYETGLTETGINISLTIEETIKNILAAQTNTVSENDISAFQHSLEVIPLIVSRHYRSPIFPIYWQKTILNTKQD